MNLNTNVYNALNSKVSMSVSPPHEMEEKQRTHWSKQEADLLRSLMPRLGKNYKEYERYFPERTYTQIKSQYHNFKNKAIKENGEQEPFVVEIKARPEKEV